jgi:proteic killer suppression protein
VEITFRTRKLEKTFNSASALRKAHGDRMAKTVAMRLAVLRAAGTLSMVPTTPPERRHQLRRDRDEQYAVDLIHPYRLVFEPNHQPLPRKEDGGLDTDQVSAITIMEVIDYH